MLERFRPSDYRFLTIAVLLLAASAWFSARNFRYAFPEASIDFRVNRDEAGSLAARFLSARGYQVTAGYRRAAQFTFDDPAKTFLERELGLEQANRIMGAHVRLWQWSNRWFRPQQKEEFSAAVTPAGEVVGFEHEIPEAAARTSVEAAQARAAAENFLRTVMRRDPAGLEFVEGSSLTRPARTDHIFTWKERGFEIKDATYRLEVKVLGDEIGAYREYLKVPEQWLRDYERLRSKNEAASIVDGAAVALLALGLLVSLVLCVRRREVRWRIALTVGAVGAVLSFLSSWNEFPLAEFAYPTTDSYPSFLARLILSGVFGALGNGVFLAVLTAAAEPLYRRAFGQRIALGNLFRPAAMRTRSFFLGTVLGLSLTGVFIAYQIGFYMIAFRLGAWSPADVPYTNLLNTRFPWAFVLFAGFMPAVSEEFLFRMFAIPFLRKLVRWMWLALVLAGLLWGFGHSAYPQQPFFIRGLEVGIGGVVLGLIMLRWGILPTLVWHYSVDAMYSALLLLRSGSLYFQLSGAASAGIMILPAAAALVAYFLKRGFEPETNLTNESERGPAGAAVEEPPASLEAAASSSSESVPSYRGWGSARRVLALAGFGVGVILLAIPVARLDERPRFRIGLEEARGAADRFLRAQQADPGAYRSVMVPAVHWQGDDALAGKYFLERRPLAWVARMFQQQRPIPYWRLRYFKELDKEEWGIAIHPETGRVVGFFHALADEQPGADIAGDQAVRIASSFAAAQGWDLGDMDLKETTSEKKKARRDHRLVWEARSGDARNLEEAHYRVEVEVAGDRVTSVRNYWKLPEAYTRSRSEQNAVSISIWVAKTLLYGTLILTGLLVLIQRIRRGQVPWRRVLGWAAPFSACGILVFVLNIHEMWQSYSTAMPFATFRVIMSSTAVLVLVFMMLMMSATVAVIAALRPEALEVLRGPVRRAGGLDALLAALLALGLAMVVQQCGGLLASFFHAVAILNPVPVGELASVSVAASGIAGAGSSIPMLLAGLALAAYVVAGVRAPWRLIPMVLVLLVALAPGEVRTPAELGLSCALGLLEIGAVVVFCRFTRDNWLGYLLAAWAIGLRGAAARLFSEPNPGLRLQAWLLVGILVATLAWAALPAMRSRERAGSAGPTAA